MTRKFDNWVKKHENLTVIIGCVVSLILLKAVGAF